MASKNTIIPGVGWVLVGDVDTATFDISKFDVTKQETFTGWTWLGSTSKENAPELSKDGGEVKVRGVWDNPAERTEVSAIKWTLKLNSVEVTQATMSLAFPSGSWDAGTESYKAKAASGTVSKALFVIMKDAENGLAGIYLPNASITLGDAPKVDPENFFEIQLSASALSSKQDGTAIQFFTPRKAG